MIKPLFRFGGRIINQGEEYYFLRRERKQKSLVPFDGNWHIIGSIWWIISYRKSCSFFFSAVEKSWSPWRGLNINGAKKNSTLRDALWGKKNEKKKTTQLPWRGDIKVSKSKSQQAAYYTGRRKSLVTFCLSRASASVLSFHVLFRSFIGRLPTYLPEINWH